MLGNSQTYKILVVLQREMIDMMIVLEQFQNAVKDNVAKVTHVLLV